MQVKLLPHLRRLNPSLPIAHFATMKPNPPLKPSRVVPIISRIFPLKLKYQSLSRRLRFPALPTQPSPLPSVSKRHQHLLGVRRFSTRSFGRKPGSEARASKSLIEDEAELSDWVSELKSNSFKSRLYSSDDDSGRDRSTDRRRGIDDRGGRGRFSSRRRDDRGGRDGFSSIKRRRENDLEEYSLDSRRARSSFGRFGGESNGENRKFVSRRGENGARGGKNFSMEKKRNVGSKLGLGLDRGAASNGGGVRRGEKSSPRRGFMASDEEIDEYEGEDEDDDLTSEEDSEEEDGDCDYGLTNASRLSPSLDEENRPVSPTLSVGKGKNDSYLSETRFDQCSISPLSLKGIKDAGYEKMTVVQEATLPVILKGKDVLAKAKTGTGKTVAFLLPSIEVVIKSAPVGRDQRLPPILVLVICPTRELASQAAAEAKTLLKYHPSIGVQVVIGGTRLALEQKRMQANPCQILVATPGRLRDHTENTAGFATRLKGVKVLVLDEADHLLDMGFRKEIEKIIAAVPKQRQTLLFSATVPEEVRLVSNIALKRDHEFINTVQEGMEETHSQVRQMHLVASLDKHFSLLYVLLKEHIADDVDYKVLVFCTTAMVTRLVADLLGELNLNVREIHSRKPQSYRTRISDEFRKSKGLILVTSDVSARGVDYPDVTLVIQVGLPADREQYIHRLGRTGRKGKAGQGILLLAPWEEFFLSTLKDLPVTKAQVPIVDPDTRKKVERALSHVEMKNKESAYRAWFGYYNSNKIVGKDKYRLVELANEFSRSMGLDNPPAIPKLVLSKMGLKNILGLRSK